MGSKIAKLLILGVAWIAFKLLRMGRRDKTLPPGPPTLPILGNIHLLPHKFAFLKFSEWANEYGGIISLKIANETIIVFLDANIVKELIEERTNETSNRPYLHSLFTVTGGNFFAFANSDSNIWKIGRKAMQPLVSPQAIQAHLPVAEAETIKLLYDVLHAAEEFCSHVDRFAFSFMTSVVYGKASTSRHDSPDVTLFTEYFRNFAKMLSPEAAPVDLLPILKHVPELFAPWKRLWRKTRKQQREVYFSLLEYTEENFRTGQRFGNIVENMIEQQVKLGLDREMLAYIGGIMLDGGVETSSSVIQSLILCLIKLPSCLKKAQDELDSVVGKERLPNSGDINNLWYIQAIIKELHRLRTVGPTGVPYAAVQEIQYRGYTIPKATPIFINVWGIMHDSDLFERPDEFWPERYLLTPDGTKPGHNKGYTVRPSLVFGGGKRMCPGMHLANTNINLAVMRLLWAFNFSLMDGLSLRDTRDISAEYNDGIALSPKPFKCRITPRDQGRVEIIEDCFKRLAWDGQ